MEYEIRDDLLYTEEHEWVRKENSIATIGITDYAQKTLSDIVYVELPEIGKKVKGGEPIAVIESVKAVSDVFSPFTGKIVEVNEELTQDPSIINKSPYNKGWIAKIEVEEGETMKLLTPQNYKELIEKLKK